MSVPTKYSNPPDPADPATLTKGIEVVFFDLFDTLIEVDPSLLPRARWRGEERPSTAPLVYEELVRHAPAVRFDELIEALTALWREIVAQKEAQWIEISALVRFERLLERLGVGGPGERGALARTLTEVHMRGISESIRPVAGAREVLGRVRRAGLGTALISNFDYAAAAPWILDKANLSGLLDKLVISESLGVRKPHERMFQEALGHFGAAPHRALHVGDAAEADIWGAGRLGLRTVWINRKGEAFPREEHAPDVSLTRLDDLLDHLD